ncbi:hypothetical protein Taro_050736 [Colocasia esculenta]|uniref:Uncharacterized protein n=1 Tax=Colocasia esculenta TaxID=4460 RepID=A0A843XE58_COLES|nr:hypothetical protein [Colocasia esculenta]
MLNWDSTLMSHVYQETNQVADSLENHACQTMQNNVFGGPSSVPDPCKGPIVLDRTSLMHVNGNRHCC